MAPVSFVPPWHPSLNTLNPALDQARTDPIGLIRGADGYGQRNSKLSSNDALLFSRFDGSQILDETLYPDPPNFSKPSPQEFLNWHSYFQQKYLHLYGQQYGSRDTSISTTDSNVLTVRFASVGGNADPALNQNFILSQDGTRIINLATLQLNDIARLSLDDQRALSGLPLFHQVYAQAFGVVPNATTPDATVVRAQIKSDIDLIVAEIQSPQNNFVPDKWDEFENDPLQRATLYHYLSLGQLSYLKARLDEMAIFSPEVIKSEYSAIRDRFLRLNEFTLMTNSDITAPNGLKQALNALDDYKSSQATRQILLSTELKLFELTKSAYDVATTGTFEDPLNPTQSKVLDAPTLVFVLQTLESYSKEAEAECLTEEMNQVNRLLEEYGKMQKLINATLTEFDPLKLSNSDITEKLGIKGNTGRLSDFNDASIPVEKRISSDDIKTLSMFDTIAAFANNNTFHPIENKNGIIRPTETMVNASGALEKHSKDVWDKLAIRLSDATKFLNQDSQVRLDTISRFNREKNRAYDLATGSLSRLSDILQAIVN